MKNKINTVLLIGVGSFGNNAILKIKDSPNISKLYTDIDSTSLAKFPQKQTVLLTENYHMDNYLWANKNHEKIYKEILENSKKFQKYIKNYDYVMICTTSDCIINTSATEAIADICSKSNKRFFIAHTSEPFYHTVVNAPKTSKQRTSKFVKKMDDKKYLTNEIPTINTAFIYDIAKVQVDNITTETQLLTQISSEDDENTNINIFAQVLELNIINMLKEVSNEEFEFQ